MPNDIDGLLPLLSASNSSKQITCTIFTNNRLVECKNMKRVIGAFTMTLQLDRPHEFHLVAVFFGVPGLQ